MEHQIRNLVAGKTDAQLATEYRSELIKALTPVVEIIDRAKSQGISINFSTGPDGYGKTVIKEIVIVKPL